MDFEHWIPPLFNTSDDIFKLLTKQVIEDPEQRSSFHTFFFAIPDLSIKRPTGARMPRIRHILPTDFLRNKVFDTYCSQVDEELQEMCRKFSPFPQICGSMFEVFAMQKLWLFREDLECSFMDGTSLILPSRLPVNGNMLSDDTPADTLWVAPSGYPTVDAVMMTSRGGKKCVTFLQMTIARKAWYQTAGYREGLVELRARG